MTGLRSNQPIFVFDVESVGLHGEGFAVGGGVWIEGIAQESFLLACDPDLADGSISDRQWVNENVPALPWVADDPRDVRRRFWEVWEGAKRDYPGVVMAADCGWPVEARFLAACVNDDKKRGFEGPYPFHEIATVLELAGMDPLQKFPRTDFELPAHNPLADAIQSARLLTHALRLLGK